MEKLGYIWNEQLTLFGEREVLGFGSDVFYVKVIPKAKADDVIIRNHFSHKIYNGSYIHLGVFSQGALLGVLQYGYAMNPASQAGVVAGTARDEYLELNRMWLDDCLERNSESRALSYSIKYIKRKYPKIQWIQSFADERCGGFGIVYQAANFLFVGEHIATFWRLDGVWYHNTLATAHNGKQGRAGDYLQANIERATRHEFRQFRYIFFLKNHARRRLLKKVLPYPKHYAQQNAATGG